MNNFLKTVQLEFIFTYFINAKASTTTMILFTYEQFEIYYQQNEEFED